MVTEGNREISFVIERYLGVLSEAQNGWRKELNLVSWNGKPAKLEIREWSPDHQKMAKGITLNPKEARILQWNLYRWLTGHGKQQEAPVPADTSNQEAVADAAESVMPEIPDVSELPEIPDVPEVEAEEVFCCLAEETEVF